MGLLVIPTVPRGTRPGHHQAIRHLQRFGSKFSEHKRRHTKLPTLGCHSPRLQIADKLCSAFGQDILDTLFAAETLGARASNNPIRLMGQRESREERAQHRRERARPFFFFLLALAYVREYTGCPQLIHHMLNPGHLDVHALVYFYQLVSLNVAVNSYDNALLTLLVSNQFVEIKGCAFTLSVR
jgi:hypothetical protein